MLQDYPRWLGGDHELPSAATTLLAFSSSSATFCAILNLRKTSDNSATVHSRAILLNFKFQRHRRNVKVLLPLIWPHDRVKRLLQSRQIRRSDGSRSKIYHSLVDLLARKLYSFLPRNQPIQICYNANKIELKNEELSLESVKQFYKDCLNEEYKCDILVSLYQLLSIIFCQVSCLYIYIAYIGQQA